MSPPASPPGPGPAPGRPRRRTAVLAGAALVGLLALVWALRRGGSDVPDSTLTFTGKQAGEAFGGIDPKFDITVPISKVIDRSLAN